MNETEKILAALIIISDCEQGWSDPTVALRCVKNLLKSVINSEAVALAELEEDDILADEEPLPPSPAA